MKKLFLIAGFVAGLLPLAATAQEGDVRRGAEAYRACVACHALESGLHLTGPSLGGVMGRTAGAETGFVRFSPGMKQAGFEWTGETLDAWIENPDRMVPGTYMQFKGVEEARTRADIVAFLAVAGKPGGADQAVAQGLMPANWLRSGAPGPLADAPASARTTSIRHCGDGFVITTADGAEKPYWEKNVRLKIDSAETGPQPGTAVILGSGMRGDRISLIFSGLADLTSLVREECP